ncbi:MAG: alpha/beta hydrolase [Lachnospiraceae bacterium]|jgi:acetyl esterase|nr:alpha/beta hydrolase [Lachnospiraceae bacterium]
MREEGYQQLKHQVIEEAKEMRRINRVIPVTGKRYDLDVGDRKINVVFYPASRKNAPLLLGFHGGGFLFGGNAMDDVMWSAIRDRLDMNVASVEYRKSPEYQYRAALDDAYDAAVYLYHHADAFGFDRERMSVMGCSAGACLAATLCIYAKQKGGVTFEHQVLLYPFLDAATNPDEKGKGSLTGPVMHIFNELHCRPEEAKDAVVSPVYASGKEVAGLPHGILVMADMDNLKQEGFRYAGMLEQAGVKTDVMLSSGMPHGFFELGFDDRKEGEMAFLPEEEKELIRSGEIARAAGEALEFVAERLVGME